MPTFDQEIGAVVAVPTRYRELLARFGSLDDLDAELRRRSGSTGWSALGHITHVADSFHMSAKIVVAIVDGDRDCFELPHADAPRVGAEMVPSRVLLASLSAAASDLARALRDAAPDALERRARVGTVRMSAREIVEDALREATTHLAEVEAILTGAPDRRAGVGSRPHSGQPVPA